MRIDRSLLGWGVFLITLGIIPLAVRAGYLDEDTVRRAWELWPLILIGIGLGLVLQRTRLAVVGGLVVAITFGLIGGGLLATGFGGGVIGCSTAGQGTPFASQSGTLGGSANVDLELSCGELEISPAAGSGWTITGSDDSGDGPVITASAERLRLQSRDARGVTINRRGDDWQLTLPTDPSLSLDIALNAGSARVDLAGMRVPDVGISVNAGEARLDLSGAATVGQLDASTNAGSLKLKLPAASLTGSVSANAGSIELCVPPDVGLRFRGSDNPLSSNNFGQRGLNRSGSTWTTPGYDSATNRIDLSVSVTVGSINLNPEAGCG